MHVLQLKCNVSALMCFHSNILRHSSGGPEVILFQLTSVQRGPETYRLVKSNLTQFTFQIHVSDLIVEYSLVHFILDKKVCLGNV